VKLPFDTLDGRQDFVVPNTVITEFLGYLLTTNGWKDRPDALHDRALRFRKQAHEQRTPIAAAKPAS
jgi:hypothetical protein